MFDTFQGVSSPVSILVFVKESNVNIDKKVYVTKDVLILLAVLHSVPFWHQLFSII